MERIQPNYDLRETESRHGVYTFELHHTDEVTGFPAFRVEVWPPEAATRWSAAKRANVTFHSSSSRGTDSEAALAIAEAIRRAGMKAAEMDRA